MRALFIIGVAQIDKSYLSKVEDNKKPVFTVLISTGGVLGKENLPFYHVVKKIKILNHIDVCKRGDLRGKRRHLKWDGTVPVPCTITFASFFPALLIQ